MKTTKVYQLDNILNRFYFLNIIFFCIFLSHIQAQYIWEKDTCPTYYHHKVRDDWNQGRGYNTTYKEWQGVRTNASILNVLQ